MRHTHQEKKCLPSRGRQVPDLKNFHQIRIPKDFLFLLMEKLVFDLASAPTRSGDAPLLAHPDIDLSEVKRAIRRRNFTDLLESVKPFGAQSISSKWAHLPEKAFGLYQLHTLLKKFPLSGAQCKTAAFASFLKYERHCKVFNDENWKAIAVLDDSHPEYLGIIEEIREDIRRCIGDEPNLQSVFDFAKHGPGTALGLEHPMVTNYFKWSSLPYSVSPKAKPIAQDMIRQDQRWLRALNDRYEILQFDMENSNHVDLLLEMVMKEVDYCRYGTVPKTAETDRSIGIEPLMNVMLQLGVDGVIRRRLKHRWGIDLNSQVRNQQLAWASSITDEDATIDLRGASDCAALMACIMLLPKAWLDLLCKLRSENILFGEQFTGGKKKLLPLSKISAMGNGFTFVLESLIFTAICRAVMRRRKIKGSLAVFGDDIIVPKAAAPHVIDLLGLFGFEINVDKTFISGKFRESCGVDCLDGTNIRPLFLKTPVTKVADLWYLLNSLFVLERRLPWYWEVSFQHTREWLYKFLPQDYRGVVGPIGESLDTYLFKENVRYDHNGLHKHWAICPVAEDFSDRAPGWYFRLLMCSLRASTKDDLGLDAVRAFKGGREWLDGALAKMSTADGSAFDVTLRGVVRPRLITSRSWRSSYDRTKVNPYCRLR